MDNTTRVLFTWLKHEMPIYFSDTKVLDVGSYYINGTLWEYFAQCDYKGLDIRAGDNVHIVCMAGDYDAADESYDAVVSAGTFEHDQDYARSLNNMIRILKRGGLLAFTCATTGFDHHCDSSDGVSIPSNEVFGDYYKNLTPDDIKSVIDMDIFSEYHFGNISFNIRDVDRREKTLKEQGQRYRGNIIECHECVLTFWGIKK